MASKQLAITFEPNVPVTGQILILEAVDFLYSLAILRDIGWSEEVERQPDWHRFVTTSPGKLLSRENVLQVHSAYSSAVTEVVEGVDKGVELLKKLLGRIKQLRGAALAQERLRVIREELLPLIEKFKKLGVSEDRLNKMLDNAAIYADEVLTELMTQNKLQIR